MKNRILKSLYISFFAVFTFLGFGALELYFSNREELWFVLADILPLLIIIIIVSILLFTAISLFLPDKVFPYYLVSLWGISVAMYLQGNFLPNDYGALNGEAIIWSDYRWRGVLGIAVWSVLIFFSIFLYKKFKERFFNSIFLIAGIILATQISTLTILGISVEDTDKNQAILSEEGMLEISASNNMFVFVLDCFDAQVMNELLDSNSEDITSSFEDFTFYPDTVGGATRTAYAIPYIISGKAYTDPLSYSEYLKKEFSNSPLLNELKDNNWDSRFYTSDAFIDLSQHESIKNIVNTSLTPTSHAGLTKTYLKLVAFRYAPQFLKRIFWVYSEDLTKWKGSGEEVATYVMNDPAFAEKLNRERLQLNQEKNVFRFYHLTGAHPPFIMDEKCLSVKNGTEKNQALGSLKIVSNFINQLKELQVYKNSTIIVMSDHGSRGLEQNPLFMIKPNHAKNAFAQSNFPLSYANLQDIFIHSLQQEQRFPEEYITPLRQRYFYVDSSDNNTTSICEYVSSGKAYDVNSFLVTGNTYHGNTDTLNKIPTYQIGSLLDFSIAGNARKYCVEGFSKAEEERIWTLGASSKMAFDLKGTFNNLLLEFECQTYAPPQRLKILANGHEVLNTIITERGKIKAIIPGDYIENNLLELEFLTPDAASPSVLEGTDIDGRLLALAMHNLLLSDTPDVLYEKDYPAWKGDDINVDFSEQGNNGDYIVSGWWDQEKEGQWTTQQANLALYSRNNKDTILMKLSGEILKDYPMEVYVNRHCIWEGEWKKEETEKEIIIPKEIIPQDDWLVISFCFPSATSPYELGNSLDTRTLGLFVKQINFSSNEEGTTLLYEGR